MHLISKNKMKIADVEILVLIDQYLAIVNGPDGVDLDATSEFIEMAARLVYMKSVFLLPRSEEADQLRQELTGLLVEYSVCKQVAAQLAAMGEGVFVAVRSPASVEFDETYTLKHDPIELVNAYGLVHGRSARRSPAPAQEAIDPIVSAPMVSVASRIIHVLRGLVTGRVKKLRSLFSAESSNSENVATFLAVLELVKAGRITVDEEEGLALQKRPADRREHGTGTV